MAENLYQYKVSVTRVVDGDTVDVDVDLDKRGLHPLADLAPGGGVGRDRRNDCNTSVAREEVCNVADAADVRISVLLREAQLFKRWDQGSKYSGKSPERTPILLTRFIPSRIM